MIGLSVAASALVIVSVLLRDRRKSLAVQSTSCLLESLYSFTISAYTSGVLNLVNFIRTFLFMRKDKFSEKTYLFILILFETIVLGNCYATWAGVISLLPTVASIVRTYCLWQTNMLLIRVSGVVSGLLYSLYYLYYSSWFMLLGYAFLFCAGVYALVHTDILRRGGAVHG